MLTNGMAVPSVWVVESALTLPRGALGANLG